MLSRFVAGLVGSAFGVEGYCKVHSLSGEIDHLIDLDEVILRRNGSERTYKVEDASGSPSSFVMKFAGIDTPEAAKALAGAELMLDRKDASPLGKDEFYVEDLKSVSLIFGGEKVAEITDVLEGGGALLLDVKLTSGERRLIPFRNEFIGAVDLKKGTALLLVDWILE